MRPAGIALAALVALPAPFAAAQTAADSCAVSFTAEDADAGLVRAVLDAPCAAGTTVTLFHDALTFQAKLDDVGHLTALLPALSPEALLMASLADGTSAAAVAPVAAGPARTILIGDTMTPAMVKVDDATQLGPDAMFWAGQRTLTVQLDPADCGKTLTATVISVDSALHSRVLPLDLALPACPVPGPLLATLILGD
ncbi:hypothetical protein BVG79_02306 [Ketogulonicigenium robustum]|uniref:Uncharacterized protein n=1 Tax=Ketogulonicigenium robustum TaxID=92947 RepID=A0A1W6P2E1_9RHOB|nr:hypothetical protein [Ketogulonicigenium robustum]ARO15646.1 hypothetical protein BVG79_02306 [Ketogulonicigenium robustum]